MGEWNGGVSTYTCISHTPHCPHPHLIEVVLTWVFILDAKLPSRSPSLLGLHLSGFRPTIFPSEDSSSFSLPSFHQDRKGIDLACQISLLCLKRSPVPSTPHPAPLLGHTRIYHYQPGVLREGNAALPFTICHFAIPKSSSRSVKISKKNIPIARERKKGEKLKLRALVFPPFTSLFSCLWGRPLCIQFRLLLAGQGRETKSNNS